jgi:hypothetical protein
MADAGGATAVAVHTGIGHAEFFADVPQIRRRAGSTASWKTTTGLMRPGSARAFLVPGFGL